MSENEASFSRLLLSAFGRRPKQQSAYESWIKVSEPLADASGQVINLLTSAAHLRSASPPALFPALQVRVMKATCPRGPVMFALTQACSRASSQDLSVVDRDVSLISTSLHPSTGALLTQTTRVITVNYN